MTFANCTNGKQSLFECAPSGDRHLFTITPRSQAVRLFSILLRYFTALFRISLMNAAVFKYKKQPVHGHFKVYQRPLKNAIGTVPDDLTSIPKL